jgi:hypothetical protein
MKRLPITMLFLLLFVGIAATPPRLLNTVVQAEELVPAAVLDLGPKGDVSTSEASILTDRIRSLVVKSRLFRVMERESMDKILQEQGFSTTQNCDSADCSLQIGRLLSVRRIITGSVSKLGNIYSLNLRVIDVERGTILEEEFTDCNCSLGSLMVEKLPLVVERVLKTPIQSGNTEPLNQNQNNNTSDFVPVRKLKPWMVSADLGYINYAGLNLQYNFNEYFALRLGGAYGAKYEYVFNPSPDGFGLGGYTTTYPNLSLNGGLRVYFNPHEWAFFWDLYGSTNFWLGSRLGLEYRNPWGLALELGLGAGLSSQGSGLDGILGIGYAF